MAKFKVFKRVDGEVVHLPSRSPVYAKSMTNAINSALAYEKGRGRNEEGSIIVQREVLTKYFDTYYQQDKWKRDNNFHPELDYLERPINNRHLLEELCTYPSTATTAEKN